MNKCLELFLIYSMILSFILIVSFTYFYSEISKLKERLSCQKDIIRTYGLECSNNFDKLIEFLGLEEFEEKGFRKKVKDEEKSKI